MARATMACLCVLAAGAGLPAVSACGEDSGSSSQADAGPASGGAGAISSGGSGNASSGATGGSGANAGGGAGGGSAGSGAAGGSGSGGSGGGGGSGGNGAGGTGGSGGGPLGPNACSGYSTRYWDCCKAHCGWTGNVNSGIQPVTSCSQDDTPQTGQYDLKSSCEAPGAGSSHTCFSMRPWQVNSSLSYGFAAVPANGDICGRCYQLEFDGTGHYQANEPGSAKLKGKTMIVQATNIGYDVSGGQFDVLIPGGGVGAFNACTQQWKVADNKQLGAQYGGFLTACRQDSSNNTHSKIKACVKSRCQVVFNNSQFSDADLLAGCNWFVDWFEAADNPNLKYTEVECPQAIIDRSGVDRRPLNDVSQKCK